MFLISLIRLTAIICLHRSHIISKPCSSYHFVTKSKIAFLLSRINQVETIFLIPHINQVEAIFLIPHINQAGTIILILHLNQTRNKTHRKQQKSQGSARKRTFLGFITAALSLLNTQRLVAHRKTKKIPLPSMIKSFS